MTNDLEKLREEIGLVLAKWLGETGSIHPQFLFIADDILALPQIADLLRMKAVSGQPSTAP